MADPIDEMIREALLSAASPASAEGVADRIRERLAAGEPGAPARATEFGGSPRSWLLAAGAAVLAGGAGIVLGLSGILPALGDVAKPPAPPAIAATIPADRTSGAYCPGGEPVVQFTAGEDVYITARSETGDHLEVRHPLNRGARVWVPAASVELSGALPADLPLGGCEILTAGAWPDPTIETPETTPPEPPIQTPKPTTPPTTPAPTTPPADTTAPIITHAFAAPTVIYQTGAPAATSSTVAVGASDDVGVTSIRATWTAVGNIPAGDITISGSSGSFVLGPYGHDASGDRHVVITLVAKDAAGNSSAPSTVTVTVRNWIF